MLFNTMKKYGKNLFLPVLDLSDADWKVIDAKVAEGLETGVCPWAAFMTHQDCSVAILEQLTGIKPFPVAPQPKHLGDQRCQVSTPSNT